MKHWHWYMLHRGQALKTYHRAEEARCERPTYKIPAERQVYRKLDGHQRIPGSETRVDTAQRRKVPSRAGGTLLARRLHHTLYSDGPRSKTELLVCFAGLGRMKRVALCVHALYRRATAPAFDKATMCLSSRSYVYAGQRST